MKVEVHSPFKDGKPSEWALDTQALICYPTSLPGCRFKVTDRSQHDAPEGVTIKVIGTKAEFDFLVGRFPALSRHVRFEHVPG